MQEEQVIYSIETEYFTQCLPLLDKYFGITAGYFNDELQQARCLIPHKEGNTITYSVKENCNLSLLFQHIDYNKLTAQINAIPITPLLEEVLILVAYCIRERQINDNDLNDLIQFHMWDTYQSEWAQLVLFMEKMETRFAQMGPDTEQTSITIQTDSGMAEKVSIPNSNNWLFRLIKKELTSYFPEVQNVDDARKDILNHKPTAGRKKTTPSIPPLHTASIECFMRKTSFPASPICRTNYANSSTTTPARRNAIPTTRVGAGISTPRYFEPIFPPTKNELPPTKPQDSDRYIYGDSSSHRTSTPRYWTDQTPHPCSSKEPLKRFLFYFPPSCSQHKKQSLGHH